MRFIGIALMTVGLVWGVCAFNMKTSVDIGPEILGVVMYKTGSVHNLALADQRRNHLMGAGVTLVSGILLFGFSSMKPKEAISSTTKGRKCPFCAEIIKEEAVVCRYCNKDLPVLEKELVSNFNNAYTPENAKPTKIIQELSIDAKNRLRCPLCKSGVTLDDDELRAMQFNCSSCKSIIVFTPKAINGNAWT